MFVAQLEKTLELLGNVQSARQARDSKWLDELTRLVLERIAEMRSEATNDRAEEATTCVAPAAATVTSSGEANHFSFGCGPSQREEDPYLSGHGMSSALGSVVTQHLSDRCSEFGGSDGK